MHTTGEHSAVRVESLEVEGTDLDFNGAYFTQYVCLGSLRSHLLLGSHPLLLVSWFLNLPSRKMAAVVIGETS